MNIFKRELKAHLKSLIFWSVGMFAMIGAGMAKYGALNGSGQSMSAIIEKLPKGIQAVLGISGFDLSKAMGYYGILFAYLVLMATVHAAMLGAEIIAKEERDKTTEFLVPKPITRTRIVSSKMAAAFLNIALLNLITFASSLLLVKHYTSEPVIKEIAVLMAGLFFLQLLFLCIGAFTAAIKRKPKTATYMAMAYLLFAYVTYIATGINSSLEKLKYLTPFKYFEAKNLMADLRLDPAYVTLSLTICAVLTAITLISYKKRDLGI